MKYYMHKTTPTSPKRLIDEVTSIQKMYNRMAYLDETSPNFGAAIRVAVKRNLRKWYPTSSESILQDLRYE